MVEFSFCRMVLALRTFKTNLLLILKPMQASKSSLLMLKSFEKLGTTHLFSASLFVKDSGNPTVSRVSFLQYWAFAQHFFLCQLGKKTTTICASSSPDFSCRCFSSSKTVALEILFCFEHSNHYQVAHVKFPQSFF